MAKDEREKRRYPRKIGSIVSQLMARRGYAQVQAMGEMQRTIESVIGPELAKSCNPGNVNRGTLQVTVTDSVIGQELSFQKRSIIKALQKEFPQSGIKDIRFRVG